MTSTTWPEGVIARYLTVGGATVDITAEISLDEEGDGLDCDYKANCSGCKDEHSQSSTQWVNSEQNRRKLMALDMLDGRLVRRWAQSHAESCRAMPEPAR